MTFNRGDITESEEMQIEALKETRGTLKKCMVRENIISAVIHVDNNAPSVWFCAVDQTEESIVKGVIGDKKKMQDAREIS